MSDKLETFEKKLEFTGDLDPDISVTSVCLSKVEREVSVELKTSILLDCKELEKLFIWSNSYEIGQWKGKWKLTLERID